MSPPPKLLNYTTTVAATKTAGEVQQLLARAGATQVLMSYGSDGRPTGVAFSVPTPLGVRTFLLPVDAQQTLKALRNAPFRYRNIDQAERVAWRIVKDWLEAQLAIIATEMVSFDQVMLPYMRADDGRTMYDLYRADQLALPAGGVS